MRVCLAEHAVDAVADGEVAVDGLEVDVGGALLDALADERVDELDDRRVVGRVAQVDDLGAPPSSSIGLGDDDVVEAVEALRSARRCPRSGATAGRTS